MKASDWDFIPVVPNCFCCSFKKYLVAICAEMIFVAQSKARNLALIKHGPLIQTFIKLFTVRGKSIDSYA
jgi:hypothetical protein